MPSKGGHVRFGSEEPEIPHDMQAEEDHDTRQDDQEDSEDSSDGDAPEAVDNAAQLSKIKAEAQRLQKAKQRSALFSTI